MRHDDLVRIADTRVEVTRLGLGTVPIGGLYSEVSDLVAAQTLQSAYDLGIRYFDTAPVYGFGLAERRLGSGLTQMPRAELTLSTKAGRLLRIPDETADGPAWPEGTDVDESQFVDGTPIFKGIDETRPVWDFSYDGTMRSVEESLLRLGVDAVDLVLIHDPEDHMEQAIGGTWRALTRLRDDGVIGAVGVGMDHCWIGERFLDEAPVDCLLVAGRTTLLDRSAADTLLPRCREAGVSVIAGSVFNSGILATEDLSGDVNYWYARADQSIVDRAQQLATLCQRYDVPLRAAALQFPYRFDPVVAVVVGARSPEEVTDDVAMLNLEIPDALWGEIDDLPPTPA